jgi:exonuclease SbcD
MEEKKVPCALLINDIHVSRDSIPEFQKNWNEALAVCKRESVTDLIVGGDLWQSRASQTLSVLLAVREALMESNRLGIDVTLAEGNHCKVDQESVYGYSHIFGEYPGTFVVNEYKCYDYGNTSLYVMSYFPEKGSFPERLERLVAGLDGARYNILYAHQGISGALAVPTDDELPAKVFEDFDKVLVGHYHNRCKIKNTHIEYIGSSRQHNFGEDEEKGYTLLYTDGSTEFIKNRANVRYKVFELTAKQMNGDMPEDMMEAAGNPDCLVKVKISCNETEAALVNRERLLEMGVSKVDIVSGDLSVNVRSSDALDVRFDKSGIKREYAGFCERKEIHNVELGLKYLEKINQSCGR